MTEEKKMKIVFAPGALDDFEGSQEELDAMVAEIQALAESGELFDRSEPVDFDKLLNEDPETLESILTQLDALENNQKKNLH